MAACSDEPIGLQKLRSSSMVILTREESCCSHLYAVASNEGTLFTSKGTYGKYFMYDGADKMVLSITYKSRIFSTSFIEVCAVNYPLLKVVKKGGFSSTMLVVDEQDQTRLKIRTPPMFSSSYSVLGADDIRIGKLKKDWGEWELTFPQDLDVSYKASLLATCILVDKQDQERDSYSLRPLLPQIFSHPRFSAVEFSS